MLKIATVCSGIGSPEVAIGQLSEELCFDVENVFACDIDKYARASYLANFKPGKMFTDMTSDEFHDEAGYSDLFIGGIPCQAFSLAGKRLGELDRRGLLFYDFYKYVKYRQPKVFIIENVKGLLSDNKGKTFQNWLLLLGRSINQHEQMFLHPDSLEYNLHYTVLNSKDFGVPQNRERVFIVGIRKDLPNNFRFPIGWKLDKRLKDILETDVDKKYYLSDKMLENFSKKNHNFNGSFKPKDINELANCVTASYHMFSKTDNFVNVIGEVTPNSQAGKVYNTQGLSPTIMAGTYGYALGYIADQINNSDNLTPFGNSQDLKFSPLNGCSQTINAGHFNQPKILIEENIILAARQTGRNPENPKSRVSGLETIQMLEINENPEITNTLTTVQKDNLVLEQVLQLNVSKESGGKQPYQQNRVYSDRGLMTALDTESGRKSIYTGYRIRRLTPLECWRLQAFPDETFWNAKKNSVFKEKGKPDKWGMSDTQLYKQSGNSMTSSVMKAIIKNTLPILIPNDRTAS